MKRRHNPKWITIHRSTDVMSGDRDWVDIYEENETALLRNRLELFAGRIEVYEVNAKLDPEKLLEQI